MNVLSVTAIFNNKLHNQTLKYRHVALLYAGLMLMIYWTGHRG